jgi:uncharacterized membrane protein (UPF0127 family)
MQLYCNQKLISNEVNFCDDFISKAKGLMFSRKLKNNECLVLNNSSSIHMLFVFQDIDVVWLNNKKVVDKKENIKSFSLLIKPKVKTDKVIELPLGKAKLFKLGNKVDFR